MVGKHPLQVVVAEREPGVPPDRAQDVLGRGAPDTILSGVVELVHVGMWPVALPVFFRVLQNEKASIADRMARGVTAIVIRAKCNLPQ